MQGVDRDARGISYIGLSSLILSQISSPKASACCVIS